MRVLPGICPCWALSLESSCNPALVPSQPPLGAGTTPSLGIGSRDTGQGSTRGRIRPRPELGGLARLGPGVLSPRTRRWWVGEPKAVRVSSPLLLPRPRVRGGTFTLSAWPAARLSGRRVFNC